VSNVTCSKLVLVDSECTPEATPSDACWVAAMASSGVIKGSARGDQASNVCCKHFVTDITGHAIDMFTIGDWLACTVYRCIWNRHNYID
jgi:hypothetical protein